MKILLLSFNWVEYLIEMANALTTLGHDVHVIFKTDRVRATVGDALPDLLGRKVRYHLLDDRPRGFRDPQQLLTAGRLIRLIRQIRPDVVNLHDASTTYLPFCLALSGRERPLVITIHDVTSHPGRDSRAPSRQRWVHRYLRGRADAVILHGVWLLEQYLAQPGTFCRNAYVIPHGCYTVFRHWASPRTVPIGNSALFFGRIHEYKGLGVLLRAAERVARQVSDFKVIIAGAGADLDRHRSTIEANPQRFILHDSYLPNSVVAQVFQEASLIVLPYVEASQSGVVRIAYAFGKPVIASDVGSIAESIRDGETGLLVPPRDENALADAIISLLCDRARLAQMSGRAAEMPDTAMSWHRIAEQTTRVYEGVLKPRHGAHALAPPSPMSAAGDGLRIRSPSRPSPTRDDRRLSAARLR